MIRTTIALRHCLFLVLVLVLLSSSTIFFVDASLVISEIAFAGTGESTCNNEEWIELFYTDPDGVVLDLTGFVLHDNKGEDDEDAFIFASGITMAPGQYLVLCSDKIEFGIGADDTISLLDATRTPIYSVTLPGNNEGDETYAYFNGEYKSTSEPTPGEANIYIEVESLEEKQQSQNNAGNDFFLVDTNDHAQLQAIFSKVVDIYVSMDDESLATIEDHPAWEKYVVFNEIAISNTKDDETNTDEEEASTISSAGKIRVKGHWSKVMTVCLGFQNTPFQIEFDEPFLGMETIYLRNHQDDFSFMRDHASNTILKAVGLPYMRSRPARLYLNGSYVGFYTLLEAPTQGYVMQRSFGAFDREKTALFKIKSSIKNCPFTISDSIATTKPAPDPYYFERGDHREDLPVLGFKEYDQCVDFFQQDRRKEYDDEARGYLEYDKNCALAMVKLGQVDRDYGPKLLEEPMVEFLKNTFYNETNEDWTDFVDIDQWLQNLAVYAITLNIDSPMGVINNWYLATTNSGDGDWKIVQYDFHGVATKSMVQFGCDSSCRHRMAYWPILRPTCGSVEDHKIVGRILNSDENVQKYLDYLQQYVNILTTDKVIEKLYAYGNGIKKFVMDDSWNHYPTLEAYERSELGTDIQDFNTDSTPYLKIMQVRLQEIQKQLDAIKDGTLPGDGVYDQESVCPDWRDSNSENYILSDSTTGGESSIPHSGTFVESDSCQLLGCVDASNCFDHTIGMCAYDGEILSVECQSNLYIPRCKPCFPYSRCGSDEAPVASQGEESSGADCHMATMASMIIAMVVVTGLSLCQMLA